MNSVYNFTLKELTARFIKRELPRHGAYQVFNWVYKKRIEDFERMSNLSKQVRIFLKENFCFDTFTLNKEQVSSDGTHKYLFELSDAALIETVLIPEKTRLTLCVSTQVGCKFNCSFCASGASGFTRNLAAAEIIGQYLWAVDSGRKPTNIVFMGIGEPLDNFDHVTKAIAILTEPQGIAFSKRKICVSTAGITEAIQRLLQLNLGIKLSVSLHSADNEIRSRLMPINKKYPLRFLIAALQNSRQYQHYPITFEYAVISGLNTRKKDADLLSQLLHGLSYKINLIPLNKSCGPYQPPGQKEVAEFTRALKKKGIIFTLRKPRGEDIDAACGQLRASCPV